MNPLTARDAIAVEVHAKRFRLNTDEWVAIIAIILLAVGLIYGTSHPAPQAVSCYQASTRP